MDLRETGMILNVLEVAFPQFYCKQDEKAKSQSLQLWHMMFANEKAMEVGAAVKAFIATNTSGFPPSIGQIKARLLSLKMPDMLDEAQAWALVSKAIRNSKDHAKEEFQKLPDIVQKVVCSPAMLRDWAEVDCKTLQTVVASNFQRSYRERLQQVIDQITIPTEVQSVLQNATPLSLPGGEPLPASPSTEGLWDDDDEEERLWFQKWREQREQFEETEKEKQREKAQSQSCLFTHKT